MKKIDLSKYVPLAEIISSLAIVISLLYAVTQYQRSNTLSNRDVENILYENMKEMSKMVADNEGLANLIVKAYSDTVPLTPAEKLRYLAFEHIFFDSWESAWSYYQDGIFEKENWESWNTWFVSELKTKPAISWEGNRKNYNGDFLDYINSIMKKE